MRTKRLSKTEAGRGLNGNTSGDSISKRKKSRSSNNADEEGGRDGKQATMGETSSQTQSQEENHGGERKIAEEGEEKYKRRYRLGMTRQLRKDKKGWQKEKPGGET